LDEVNHGAGRLGLRQVSADPDFPADLGENKINQSELIDKPGLMYRHTRA
jgi:hypothetical protein